MPEPITVAGLLAAAQKLIAAKNEAEKNVMLIEFQTVTIGTLGKLADLQSENASLKAENLELKQERMRLQDWSAEKVGYALQQVGPGVFAHVKNDQTQDFEAAHKLCSNCFGKNTKSILQQGHDNLKGRGNVITLNCPNGCRSLSFTHYFS